MLLIVSCLIVLSCFVDAKEEKSVYLRYCKKISDCDAFGYWCDSKKTCQCAPFYIPNEAKTACIGTINQRCRYDDHCIQHAYCHNQTICQCKMGFISADKGTRCKSDSAKAENSLLKILAVILIGKVMC